MSLTQPVICLAASKRFASEIYFWLGVIVALAFVMGMIALWLRKKLVQPVDDQPPVGFTIRDLRRLHEAGQLSDEELARAEEKALSRSRSKYLGESETSESEITDLGDLSTGSEGLLKDETENFDTRADKNSDGGLLG